MYAITLFKIQEEKQVEDYLEWSKLNIRPRMLEIESVIEFILEKTRRPATERST